MTFPRPADVLAEALRQGQRDDTVNLVDFSYNPKPIQFKMDGDVYECYPILAPTTMQDLGKIIRSGGVSVDPNDEGAIEATLTKITQIFEQLMEPASALKMNSRILGKNLDPNLPDDAPKPRPVDLMHQVLPALRYIMEQHGLRPTQPLSDSPSG